MADPGVLLNTGQMKIAEKANDRVSKLREAVIKTKHKAKKLLIKEKFKKRFKISELERDVSSLKRELRAIQDKLSEARERAEDAASAELSEIEAMIAQELEEESVRTTTASLSILGASLPPDIRKELALEDTKKLITTKKK